MTGQSRSGIASRGRIWPWGLTCASIIIINRPPWCRHALRIRTSPAMVRHRPPTSRSLQPPRTVHSPAALWEGRFRFLFYSLSSGQVESPAPPRVRSPCRPFSNGLATSSEKPSKENSTRFPDCSAPAGYHGVVEIPWTRAGYYAHVREPGWARRATENAQAGMLPAPEPRRTYLEGIAHLSHARIGLWVLRTKLGRDPVHVIRRPVEGHVVPDPADDRVEPGIA